MILRRSTAQPEPPWRPRVDRARRIIERQGADDTMAARLATIEEALHVATADLHQLGRLIEELEPEHATRELKDALRRQAANPGSVDASLVGTMRRRYESIHALQNRREALAARIDATVADIEALAARSIELRHETTVGAGLGNELDRLHDDLSALDAAHRELDLHAPRNPGGSS